MANTTAKSTDAPAKTPKQEAAEALVALMAPGKTISQISTSADAMGEPTMVVVYLAPGV